MNRALRLLAPLRHLVPPLLVVALVWLVVARACAGGPPGVDPGAAPQPVVPRGDLADDEKATIALFEQAAPSVVHVANLVVVRDRRTMNPMEIPQGTGTGFVWDDEGHVVTNFHVVANGDDFVVALADRTQHHATLVGVAESYDLAVLHVDPGEAKLRPLPLGTSSDLRVGQRVYAIGNPFGLDQTLTHGILSGLGREVQAPNLRPIYDVIQTDAAINPGNSGGPLLDSAGRVIGVNSQIASPSGGSSGVGFAIPVDTVNLVVPELIRKGGRYVRPILGVRPASDYDPRVREADGAVVVDVVYPGTGAARAGLRSSDVIRAVGGEPVRNRIDLFRVVDHHEVGDKVSVTVLRDGREQTLDVVLIGTDDQR